MPASDIPNTNTPTFRANLNTALNTLDSDIAALDTAKAPKAGPTFTGSTTVTRSASPGAGINQVAYIEANYSPSVGETGFGSYSRFINSGSTTPTGGEHLVGSLGRAGDTSAGKFTMYGHESRVDGAGTALEYGAQFTFALFGGSTFTGQSLVGDLVRSEVYTDGTYTTPLAQGTNVGVKVAALVGGALKRSFVGFDEIQNQAPIGAYNTAGSESTKIYHDSDSGFIAVSGGTGGNLKLNPAASSYVIQSSGLGHVPLSEGLSLGINSFRWAANFTTATFKPGASFTPANNGEIGLEFTSNTSVTIKGKGSDGTVRSVVLTLA